MQVKIHISYLIYLPNKAVVYKMNANYDKDKAEQGLYSMPGICKNCQLLMKQFSSSCHYMPSFEDSLRNIFKQA